MKPYYRSRFVTLYQGDCLTSLQALPDQSIQCCVTSPPYWGLRDYGVPKTVWGGDPKCKHVWGEEIAVHATNHTDKRRWSHGRNGRGEEQPVEKRPGWKRQTSGQGSYCACGAWLGALGLEPTPYLFVEHLTELFREVRRVLRDDGTLWLNLGDSYFNGDKGAPKRTTTGKQITVRGCLGRSTPNRFPQDGLKPKDLVGIPWRVAFALQADGWYLRSDIIWHKPNPMPESVTARPTGRQWLSWGNRPHFGADQPRRSSGKNCQRPPHSDPPGSGKLSHPGSPIVSQAGSPILSHPGSAIGSHPVERDWIPSSFSPSPEILAGALQLQEVTSGEP